MYIIWKTRDKIFATGWLTISGEGFHSSHPQICLYLVPHINIILDHTPKGTLILILCIWGIPGPFFPKHHKRMDVSHHVVKPQGGVSKSTNSREKNTHLFANPFFRSGKIKAKQIMQKNNQQKWNPPPISPPGWYRLLVHLLVWFLLEMIYRLRGVGVFFG